MGYINSLYLNSDGYIHSAQVGRPWRFMLLVKNATCTHCVQTAAAVNGGCQICTLCKSLGAILM